MTHLDPSDPAPSTSSPAGTGPDVSPTPRTSEPRLSPEERAAARARRRRMRRLRWIAAGVAWVVVVVVVLSLATATIIHFSRVAHPVQHFADPLTLNSGGWPTRNGCSFHDGAYHVAPLGTRFGEVCFSPAGGYRDFDLHVTARLDSGPADAGYGLAFRAVDGGDFYAFEVSAAGYARLVIAGTGTVNPLSPEWNVPGGPFGPGTSHVLAVTARGDTITCSVDGVRVGTYADSRYSSGLVGVSADVAGMDVAFMNFEVTSA